MKYHLIRWHPQFDIEVYETIQTQSEEAALLAIKDIKGVKVIK